jgi:hypothetical protein
MCDIRMCKTHGVTSLYNQHTLIKINKFPIYHTKTNKIRQKFK